MTNTEQFLGRKVPPHLFEYAQKNAANWFWYKDIFVPKDLKKKDIPGGEVAKVFTRNWVFRTEFDLPGMLKWSEVVEELPMLELAPIFTMAHSMQETNWRHEMMWENLKKDESPGGRVSLKSLDNVLNGTIIAGVGGGVKTLEDAFLTPGYAEEHPEHHEMIETIKTEIVKQVDLIDHLLSFYPRMITEERSKETYQVYQEFHGKLKERVHSCYDFANADMYKVFQDYSMHLIKFAHMFHQFQEPVINKVLVKDRIQATV